MLLLQQAINYGDTENADCFQTFMTSELQGLSVSAQEEGEAPMNPFEHPHFDGDNPVPASDEEVLYGLAEGNLGPAEGQSTPVLGRTSSRLWKILFM